MIITHRRLAQLEQEQRLRNLGHTSVTLGLRMTLSRSTPLKSTNKVDLAYLNGQKGCLTSSLPIFTTHTGQLVPNNSTKLTHSVGDIIENAEISRGRPHIYPDGCLPFSFRNEAEARFTRAAAHPG